MSVISGILVLAAMAQAKPCEAATAKSAEIRDAHAAWSRAHLADCPLCARGSTCREGYEREAAVDRRFATWKDVHVRDCKRCSAGRCTAEKDERARMANEARKTHLRAHDACSLDARKCTMWRLVLKEVELALAAWKADHPAQCDRCAPRCPEWKRRSAQITAKFDSTLKRHQDRCNECKIASGDCERPAQLKEEWAKERLALWKVHEGSCTCRRAALRRR